MEKINDSIIRKSCTAVGNKMLAFNLYGMVLFLISQIPPVRGLQTL
jgi:hypothetical protein